MLKQELTQKQIQKLSPAQIQVIKMIELPTLELEERITQELEENIALEEGPDDYTEDNYNTDAEDEYYDDDSQGDNPQEDFNIDEYLTDDDVPDYATRTHNTSADDKHEDIPFSVGTTFHEFLISELNLMKLTPHEKEVGQFIIGNIDEEGYLRREIESIVDDLEFHENIHTTDEEVSNILQQIQQLDPAGVGARNLQECLLLQLKRRQPTEANQIAQRVIKNYFTEFSHRHLDKICQRANITDEQMRDVLGEIKHLNPKPGNAWGANLYENNQTAIIPDFLIENENGNIVISLNNSNIPELHVNREYSDMLTSYQSRKGQVSNSEKDAIKYIKQKIDSARWFIDAIRQRNETLMRTMSAIVEFQKDFFVEGDESCLKPMILKDIADMTGYDISTISRVSNSKYAQTEYGIYPLKFFFSESMMTETGDEISTRQIKKQLIELISKEDKRHPLNDDKLVVLMKAHGYNIARRTIAKYREQMGIPVARLRKEI